MSITFKGKVTQIFFHTKLLFYVQSRLHLAMHRFHQGKQVHKNQPFWGSKIGVWRMVVRVRMQPEITLISIGYCLVNLYYTSLSLQMPFASTLR